MRLQEANVARYFAARSRNDATATWSDFNLLVYAVRSGVVGAGVRVSFGYSLCLGGIVADDADMEAILSAVHTQTAIPADVADRAQQALTQSVGGGISGAPSPVSEAAAPQHTFSSSTGGQWGAEAAQLAAMGFDLDAAKSILEATNGNVEQAIRILTS